MTALVRQQDPWTDRLESLDISGITKELALNTCLLSAENHCLELQLSPEFHHLNTPMRVQKLAQVIQAQWGSEWQVRIQEAEQTALTPSQHYQQIYHQLCEQAKQHLQQDKGLQLLQAIFRAELLLDSVVPV